MPHKVAVQNENLQLKVLMLHSSRSKFVNLTMNNNSVTLNLRV